MLRTAAVALIATLSLALGLTLKIEEHRLDTSRERALAESLAASNTAALRDTTHNLALTSRAIAAKLGDSLRLVEKRAIQAMQCGDRLDLALARERRARYDLGVAIDSLQSSARTSAARDSNDVRRATWSLRRAPYTVAADVEMPAPPHSARTQLRIALDTIAVLRRITCAEPDEHGVRQASVSAESPDWARCDFGRVEQSPDVCARTMEARSASNRHMAVSRIVIGIGTLLRPRGAFSADVFIGSGFAIET